jgi:hypothetical protein
MGKADLPHLKSFKLGQNFLSNDPDRDTLTDALAVGVLQLAGRCPRFDKVYFTIQLPRSSNALGLLLSQALPSFRDLTSYDYQSIVLTVLLSPSHGDPLHDVLGIYPTLAEGQVSQLTVRDIPTSMLQASIPFFLGAPDLGQLTELRLESADRTLMAETALDRLLDVLARLPSLSDLYLHVPLKLATTESYFRKCFRVAQQSNSLRQIELNWCCHSLRAVSSTNGCSRPRDADDARHDWWRASIASCLRVNGYRDKAEAVRDGAPYRAGLLAPLLAHTAKIDLVYLFARQNCDVLRPGQTPPRPRPRSSHTVRNNSSALP